MFSVQIRRNLKVYVDDMVIKTLEERDHVKDLEETFELIRKIDMRLNPDKFILGVQAGKFMGSC